MIQAVVFDIGNVLIEWQPERLYDAVIGIDRRKAMFAEVDLHDMKINPFSDAPQKISGRVLGFSPYPAARFGSTRLPRTLLVQQQRWLVFSKCRGCIVPLMAQG